MMRERTAGPGYRSHSQAREWSGVGVCSMDSWGGPPEAGGRGRGAVQGAHVARTRRRCGAAGEGLRTARHDGSPCRENGAGIDGSGAQGIWSGRSWGLRAPATRHGRRTSAGPGARSGLRGGCQPGSARTSQPLRLQPSGLAGTTQCKADPRGVIGLPPQARRRCAGPCGLASGNTHMVGWRHDHTLENAVLRAALSGCPAGSRRRTTSCEHAAGWR